MGWKFVRFSCFFESDVSRWDSTTIFTTIDQDYITLDGYIDTQDHYYTMSEQYRTACLYNFAMGTILGKGFLQAQVRKCYELYVQELLEKSKEQFKRSTKQIKLRQIFDLQSSQAKDLLCIHVHWRLSLRASSHLWLIAKSEKIEEHSDLIRKLFLMSRDPTSRVAH